MCPKAGWRAVAKLRKIDRTLKRKYDFQVKANQAKTGGYTLASVRNVGNGIVFETGKYNQRSPAAVVESRTGSPTAFVSS
jgi:hypothetical protein